MNKKVALLILDGWGIGDKSKSDAIYNADTPFMDSLMENYPNAKLRTDGLNVGLPDGQMGNSEVGHMNIGAGRIVYQELTRINKAIEEGTFFKNERLKQAFEKAKNGKTLHLFGLVSRGGVHSSLEHLFALCDMAKQYDLEKIYIHAFTDGRDCDPKSGLGFLKELEEYIQGTNIKIATIIGRYYAMDRDNRWERIKKAYDLMVKEEGEKFSSVEEAMISNYEKDITDEFILPCLIEEGAAIKDGDVAICFNFRTDRPREISIALTQKAFPEYEMRPLNIDYYTMTNYDKTFKNITVLFEKENLEKTLGEVLSLAGKTQVRIAETEKYPHVTFFFNGGRETVFDNERRILIDSPKVATYDLKPEMSAPEITEAITEDIDSNEPDFICLNFANTDMVGHTGVYEAILKAAETVDNCVRKVIEKALEKDYAIIIIADHGNSDYALNPDGTPNTAHSLNPVPIIVLNTKAKMVNDGILRDVAPTVLDIMELDVPQEMTGKSLIV